MENPIKEKTQKEGEYSTIQQTDCEYNLSFDK